jgi:hypothetical protein
MSTRAHRGTWGVLTAGNHAYYTPESLELLAVVQRGEGGVASLLFCIALHYLSLLRSGVYGLVRRRTWLHLSIASTCRPIQYAQI